MRGGRQTSGVRTSLLAALALALALLLLGSPPTQAADTLCSVPPATYKSAKAEFPDLKFALDTLEQFGIATWYSDRSVNGDVTKTIATLVNTCPESSRLSVVVYALPNKDCAAGYSNGNGSVETSADYVAFVTQLTDAIGTRKVLYVLEPDAVGLLADGGCAVESGYADNLKLAIPLLAANPNAAIYLDVGFWTLAKPESAAAVARIVRELNTATGGKLKGITLNTSNYRSTEEIAKLCATFQEAVQSTDLHCVVDTSRNYAVPSGAASSEWCNKRTAGIGALPTSDTGYANLDYFVWIKPPGDSDGTCDGADRSPEAMQGPEAGAFFQGHFLKLWNQGYLVKEKKMATIYDPSVKSIAVRLSTKDALMGSALTLVLTLVLALPWAAES
ncbi:hypothetical protein PybrP1_007067 [[Pythium] brassicae (nom. inval.)]|nr:hypothetical protein PybrP1_007067 [[Pythium] brassicae (nom. inval.)]